MTEKHCHFGCQQWSLGGFCPHFSLHGDFLKNKDHMVLSIFRVKKPVRKLLSTHGTNSVCEVSSGQGEKLKLLPGRDPTV